ncbi:RNase J family beta-CASP ribonuclease [Candidatus Woesearchaeota archaeon]|nr:RNase J family beta-CASP ribonuclease [Candidatus Woesearchaeota archaeon]
MANWLNAMIELTAVGGYSEVGRNMTAIKAGNEAVILDIGLHMENYVNLNNDDDNVKLSAEDLLKAEALPNIDSIKDWAPMVKLIIPSHAHLDHVGGIPYLCGRYNAEVLASPFTAEVLKKIMDDEKIRVKNKIRVLNVNSVYKQSDELKVEMISITHSTPQSVIVAVHTKHGIILYANDFKFDLYPVIGKKPDLEKLRQLGDKGVLAMVIESTYAGLYQKMPSESVARQMLKDVLTGLQSSRKAIVITTFASHIARIKSIMEFGKKMNRKIVFLGRSFAKYINAAEKTGIAEFSRQAEIVKYSRQIKKKLKKVMKEGKDKYLLVVTGHQGEPSSTLFKMANNDMDFHFEPGDNIIFSCRVIPTATNIANREYLEKALNKQGARMFKDIHVSGHSAREDHREMIQLVRPKHLIPAHGPFEMTSKMAELAYELGYKRENVHLLKNGQRIMLE